MFFTLMLIIFLGIVLVVGLGRGVVLRRIWLEGWNNMLCRFRIRGERFLGDDIDIFVGNKIIYWVILNVDKVCFAADNGERFLKNETFRIRYKRRF